MKKWYRITQNHSVYGNDLRCLSSAYRYREIEWLNTQDIGNKILNSRDAKKTNKKDILLISDDIDFFRQIYKIVAFINKNYKNKSCLIRKLAGKNGGNTNEVHEHSLTQCQSNQNKIFLKKLIFLCNEAFYIKNELLGFDLHPAIEILYKSFKENNKNRVALNNLDVLPEKKAMLTLMRLKYIFNTKEYKQNVKNRKASIAKNINSISSMLSHYKIGDDITITRFCLGFHWVYSTAGEADISQSAYIINDSVQQKKQLDILMDAKAQLFSAKRKKDMFENVADYIWKIDKSRHQGYYLHVVMIVRGNERKALRVKVAFAKAWKSIVGKNIGRLFYSYGIAKNFDVYRFENNREQRNVELKAYIDDIIKLFHQDILARVACGGKKGFGRSLER